MVRKINSNKYGVIEYSIDTEEDLNELPRKETDNTVYAILNKEGKRFVYLYSKELKDYILINGDLEGINIELENINEQLDNKANLNEVIRKGNVSFDDCTEEMLAAIQNKEGETNFNLLSVPRDRSVNYKKTNFLMSGKNIFNKNDESIIEGEYTDERGYSQTDAEYKKIYIPVTSGGKYIISGINGYYYFINYRDKDGNRVSGVKGTTNPQILTIPDNAETLELGYNFSFENSIQIELGETKTSYEEFYYVIDNLRYQGNYYTKVNTNDLENNSVTAEKTNFLKCGKNLFDKNNSNRIEEGYYYNQNNGGKGE